MKRLIDIALRHWRPLLLLNFVVIGVTAYNILTTPRYWRARAELVVPQSSNDLNADLGTLGDLNREGLNFSAQLNPLNTLTAIATSNDTLQQVLESDPERDEYVRLAAYRGLFDVSLQSESTVISIEAEGSSLDLALERTNVLIETFQERLSLLREQEAEQRVQLLQSELQESEERLREAQRELVEFQESNSLVDSEEQTSEILAMIASLTASRAEIFAEAGANEARMRILSASLGLTTEQAIRALQLDNNPTYQLALNRLAEVETELTELNGRFLANSPTVRELEQERSGLLAQLNEYVEGFNWSSLDSELLLGGESTSLLQDLVVAESDAVALEAQAELLQEQIDSLNLTLASLPLKQARLTELMQQYAVEEGVYNGLVAQVEETRLSAFGTYPIVQVLEQPNGDSKPAGPSRRVMAMGGMLAAGLGSTAIVLLLEGRNPLLAPRDLQAIEIPVLETIPQWDAISNGLNPAQMQPIREYQWLASDLETLTPDRRYLMVASAVASEGKTTTAMGLAAALSSLGFRVLLVDGDFHNGTLSYWLGFRGSEANPKLGGGLLSSEVTSTSSDDGAPQSEAPQSGDSNPKNLLARSEIATLPIQPGVDLLSSFPLEDSLARFVARGQFSEYVERARKQGNYDYVIVDSAPLGLTSEATLMARAIGNVVMVVRPGASQRHSFTTSIESLQRHGTRILGIVVNGEQVRSADYYQYPRNLPGEVA